MAITRPVTKTLISTSQWGIPITDEVNRLTAAQTAGLPTAWQPMVFTNGWANYGGGYQVGQMRKIGDIVYIRGFLRPPAGNTSGTSICNLPAGFSAPATYELPALYWDGSTRRFAAISIGSSLYVNDNITAGAAVSLNFDFSTLP